MTSALDESDLKGKFVRTDSQYRSFISKDDPVYQPECGRYHLYIALACKRSSI